MCVSVSVSGERVFFGSSWEAPRSRCWLQREKKEADWSSAALCPLPSAALTRFPSSLCVRVPLSIQSLRGAMCVCAQRRSRFKAAYTSPTESRLLRHKAQPPSPSPSTLLSSSSSLLHRLGVVNLFGYGCTKEGGQRIVRLPRREEIGEQTLVPPSSD